MSNPTTAALDAMVEEFETGLAVGPDQCEGTLAPSGEVYRTFINGRIRDEGKLTNFDLITRMISALRLYKKSGVNAGGKTVYWRERPDFGMDFVNAPTVTLKCRVVISEKQLVKA